MAVLDICLGWGNKMVVGLGVGVLEVGEMVSMVVGILVELGVLVHMGVAAGVENKGFRSQGNKLRHSSDRPALLYGLIQHHSPIVCHELRYWLCQPQVWFWS